MSSLIPDAAVQVATRNNPGYVVVEGPIDER